jgi:hypothetical protein
MLKVKEKLSKYTVKYEIADPDPRCLSGSGSSYNLFGSGTPGKNLCFFYGIFFF